jgi:hypothetical protein
MMFACNDDFLERYPQTEITEANFFNNITDLRTYTFQFYDYLYLSTWDRPSDNTTLEKEFMRDLLLGNITADNYTGWNKNYWSRLRSINYFLDYYSKAEGDEAEKMKYAAMAHFFRARDYIGKVQIFSDVPWYSTTLETTDESLYKPRDTREMVVDSIIADLEFATKNLDDEEDKTSLSKWAAYFKLARFCLYEGTYRIYHKDEADLHVTKAPEYFLNKAVEAANAIMTSGKFSIQTGDVNEVYGDLFNGGADLQTSPEVIMYLDYEDDKRQHGAALVLDFENGVSRSMSDSYLKSDGTFLSTTESDTMQITDAFDGRDPRMKQSLFFPGWIHPNTGLEYKLPIVKTGGYAQIKFMPKEKGKHYDEWYGCYTDLPLYRYAEVLLIYAEAKAELGQLTQDDLDKTINVLRDRVNVGHLLMNPPIDPRQEELYPNIVTSQKAELLEIRRERRVELFAEGRRYNDMMRWKIGKQFEKPQQGIYIPSSGLVDMTGDGIPDYFISDDGSNQPSDLPEGITYLITDNEDIPIYLEKGKSGHVMFKLERGDFGTFVEPKYYYRPIPTSEMLLNQNLKQLFGWD